MHLVFTWGRFNPPHRGHQALVEHMEQLAETTSADLAIYSTHSHDTRRNPLTYEEKAFFINEAFGDIFIESEARNIIDVLDEIHSCYDSATLVVGSDRVEDFSRIAKIYCENHPDFLLQVESFGDRDPDGDDINGISASRMRQAAKVYNYDSFADLAPTTLDEELKEELFEVVVEGMLISEAPLTIDQRRKRAIRLRRNKQRIKIGRERASRRMAPKDVLQRRATKRAIRRLKRRLAGGKNYQDLSYGEKIQVDKRMQARKRFISMLTRRLLPQVRQDEIRRKLAKNVAKPGLAKPSNSGSPV